jgi:hypothetical protein
MYRILLLLSILCINAIISKVSSQAGEKSPVTANYIILRLGRFVAGVNSLDYSETRGDPKGDHSRIHWQEMGDYSRIEDFEPNLDSKGSRAGNFQVILSYDGDHGYDYTPGGDRLRIQKRPFENRMEGYSSGLYGPLMAFEFLDKRIRSSGGRVTLQTLKSADALRAVAARAVLEPDKNRSWFGHPCIAVKIFGGNNRFDSQQPVDFVVYFATDSDLYPVAWEMYKKGQLYQSFWVMKFTAIPLNNDGKLVFRYPELAKFRCNAFVHFTRPDLSSNGQHLEVPFISGADENLTLPDLKINTLSKENFTLDPSMVLYIEDLDAHKLIRVPR